MVKPPTPQPLENESQAKMTKARNELMGRGGLGGLPGLEASGTFYDRLARIKEDLKFIAVRCIQEEDLVTAQQALAAAELVGAIELPSEVEEAAWDGLP